MSQPSRRPQARPAVTNVSVNARPTSERPVADEKFHGLCRGHAVYAGWLLMHPDDVPTQWRDRALPAVLVPLHLQEAIHTTQSVSEESKLSSDELRILELLRGGAPVDRIARNVGFSVRTVHRRLASLRHRFGVGSNTELAVKVSFHSSQGDEIVPRVVAGAKQG